METKTLLMVTVEMISGAGKPDCLDSISGPDATGGMITDTCNFLGKNKDNNCTNYIEL